MIEFDRRSLLKGATAVSAAAGTDMSATATSLSPSTTAPAPVSKASATQRGMRGTYARMPTLTLESQHDFLSGYIKWQNGGFRPAFEARAAEIFKERGIDADKPTDMSLAEIFAIAENDPILQMQERIHLDGQFQSHLALRDAFHAREDEFLSELAAADKSGPGTIELARTEVPDYCKHEIHNQLGGYVGDPFAGYIYHHAFQKLFDGGTEQDEQFNALAAATPLPADGKVRRILDNGTGYGGVATAMKRRFPDAEVWAIDIAEPMIRYGHMRSNRMGVPVLYSQRLAEDNQFPDNYFDIVISTSFHHEVTEQVSKKIFAEAYRVLRPGGVFRPAESGINGNGGTPMNKMSLYQGYRWNHEVWLMEWQGMDRFGSMENAGLKVQQHGAKAGAGYAWIPGAVAWKV